MKVLWIIHDVLEPFFPYVKGKPAKGGSWIEPLFFSLSNHPEIKLGVITPITDGEFIKKKIANIEYYSVPIKKGDNIIELNSSNVRSYLKAITDFNPTIIHIHGTEKNFGLLREYVSEEIPIVCSIQGIINSYEPHLHLSSSFINYKKYKSLKNWLGMGGIDFLKKWWRKYKLIEKKIFTINRYFIGRTLWDKSQTAALNPEALYFHGEELLRPPFYKTKWNVDTCEKHSIFISSGAYPIKGLHVLLEAVNILKLKHKNLKIYIPLFNTPKRSFLRDKLIGEDYTIYINNIISKYGLQSNVVFLNRLNAEDMALQFSKSNVFVLPSFIENSPNSLGEAMSIGVPSVVSYSGGVGSMVRDEDSALFFPIGDYRTLAFQIDRLFTEENLSNKLSANAKIIAGRRHNIKETTKQYIEIYKEIIRIHNEDFSQK